MNKPTLFLIPGFQEDYIVSGYEPIKKQLSNKFKIICCDINWKNSSINDWSEQFTKQYLKNKTDKNIVVGFSFGSMIALNTAPKLLPNELVLCSLSPYFSEYLDKLPEKWIKLTSKKVIINFKDISIKKIAKSIIDKKININLLIGGKEMTNWPILEYSFSENIKLLKPKNTIIIPKAIHRIKTNYQDALIKLLNEL